MIDFKNKNVLLINLGVALGTIVLIVLLAGHHINTEIDETMQTSGVKLQPQPASTVAPKFHGGPSANPVVRTPVPQEQNLVVVQKKAPSKDEEVIHEFPIEGVMLPQ